MKQTIKNKRGFTLIEVIVGLAICMILMASAFAVIQPIGNIFKSGGEKADAQQIAGIIMEDMRGSTNRCTDISAGEDGKTVIYDGMFYSINADGYIINGKTALPADASLEYGVDFYNGKTLEFTAESAGEKKVSVTITVLKGDKKIYTVTGLLHPALDSSEYISSNPTAGIEDFLDRYGVTFDSDWENLVELVATKFPGGAYEMTPGMVYRDSNGEVYAIGDNGDYTHLSYGEAKKNPTLEEHASSTFHITETSIKDRRTSADWERSSGNVMVWRSSRIPGPGALYSYEGKLYIFVKQAGKYNEDLDPTVGDAWALVISGSFPGEK